MSSAPKTIVYPPFTEAELIAELRDIDRRLRPVNDRILARLGLTRAEVLAEMPAPDSLPIKNKAIPE